VTADAEKGQTNMTVLQADLVEYVQELDIQKGKCFKFTVTRSWTK
jgi:hypothetical protein